eukprot:1616978-Amphidinium_carterae.1
MILCFGCGLQAGLHVGDWYEADPVLADGNSHTSSRVQPVKLIVPTVSPDPRVQVAAPHQAQGVTGWVLSILLAKEPSIPEQDTTKTFERFTLRHNVLLWLCLSSGWHK